MSIDEDALRRYVARKSATREGIRLLNDRAAGGLRVELRDADNPEHRDSYIVNWCLVYPFDRGVVLRTDMWSGTSMTCSKHFAGASWCEVDMGILGLFLAVDEPVRKVRIDFPNGSSQFFEGRQMEERMVRALDQLGDTHHYEGERGCERVVRIERTTTDLIEFLEGSHGKERIVRARDKRGRGEQFFEGGQNKERVARIEFTSGLVLFCEGRRGMEQPVRVKYADGRTVDRQEPGVDMHADLELLRSAFGALHGAQRAEQMLEQMVPDALEQERNMAMSAAADAAAEELVAQAAEEQAAVAEAAKAPSKSQKKKQKEREKKAARTAAAAAAPASELAFEATATPPPVLEDEASLAIDELSLEPAPLEVASLDTASTSSQSATAAQDDDDTMCVVCFGKEKTHAIMPCLHQCLCAECADAVMGRDKTCPICREPALMAGKVYK